MLHLFPNKITVSNGLVLISLFFTILTFVPFLWIYQFGMNDIFFDQGKYFMWIIQFFTSQFLHGGIMHLAMNAIFILYFGNVLEWIIGAQKYLVFFILNAIFLWITITLLSDANTVWISGFAMAVITHYTLYLWSRGNPEYTGWVTAIVINIAIGLAPWISFLWHFWWMLFWAIFWFFTQKKK